MGSPQQVEYPKNLERIKARKRGWRRGSGEGRRGMGNGIQRQRGVSTAQGVNHNMT